MLTKRASGVLAHPTSFPSPYGIGDLGQGAYDFIDFMRTAKQTIWQVLPLGPTSYGDSPYQSFSTFAGNHYLISPAELLKQNYLTEDDLTEIPAFDPRRIDYGPLIEYKTNLLQTAFNRFKQSGARAQKAAYTRFCNQNKEWLDNYALFVAIKYYFIRERKNTMDSPELLAYRKENKEYLTDDQINDYFYGAVWNSWPSPLARRDAAALQEISTRLAEEIEFHKFLQFEFFREWNALKDYAKQNGITVIGDLPIFVAMDSSDVWAEPDLYFLDDAGRPELVAGVPPDYFSETGQLWGNPLYDWAAHKKTGYVWWIRRVGAALKLTDFVRIDHFRGFESYWAIPYGEPTAVKGKWTKGPGKSLFEAMHKKLGTLNIIAEDLGVITEKVDKLRKSLHLPGMKVLQFAFDPEGKSAYLPHNFTDVNTVVYTGTHDNDTSIGWYAKADEAEKDYLRRYLNISGEDVAWDMIRLAFSSIAAVAVVPIQDVLNLDSRDRMNIPGIPSGNWQFRYTADMLSEECAKRLAYLSSLYNR